MSHHASLTSIWIAVGCLLAFLVLSVHCTVSNNLAVVNHEDNNKYVDCAALQKVGYTHPGVYAIWTNPDNPIKVYCENNETNAFTVIQRRMIGNIPFARGWMEYMYGFGDAQGDFWAGLYNINVLTSQQGNTVLTIHMSDWAGHSENVRYSHFVVLGEQDKFQMFTNGYTGSIGDDFGYSSGQPFATWDNPDLHNCSIHQKAGWWYNYCSKALLNGWYYIGGHYVPTTKYYDGVYWKDWLGFSYSLKFVSMSVSRT